jgi:hypothetical protein
VCVLCLRHAKFQKWNRRKYRLVDSYSLCNISASGCAEVFLPDSHCVLQWRRPAKTKTRYLARRQSSKQKLIFASICLRAVPSASRKRNSYSGTNWYTLISSSKAKKLLKRGASSCQKTRNNKIVDSEDIRCEWTDARFRNLKSLLKRD